MTDQPIDAPPLLSVRISAGYRARADVLRGVAFEIEPGEIVGLAAILFTLVGQTIALCGLPPSGSA